MQNTNHYLIPSTSQIYVIWATTLKKALQKTGTLRGATKTTLGSAKEATYAIRIFVSKIFTLEVGKSTYLLIFLVVC